MSEVQILDIMYQTFQTAVKLTMPFLLVSILCSGAIVRPELLPAGLGALRFLSPAWYALRLLSIL